MCGRYSFTAEQIEGFWNSVKEISDQLNERLKTGEIYPTNLAPIIVADNEGQRPNAMTWGFPHFKGNGVIINAKSETVTEKKMFRDSVITRRCIVPSNGFYEWGAGEDGQQSLFATAPKAKNGKTKYLFNLPGEKVLYMAGFWKQFNGEDDGRFVILTTAANSSMQEIHDRMPVVLRPEEQKTWLSNGTDFEKLFDRKDVLLEHIPA